MRNAIIDLGTNSVRFDVHQFGQAHQIKRIHREKIMVRLGQGVFLNGRLNKDAIRRTLHAFVKFKYTAERLGVSRILAFGTSALRDATDADQFIKYIYAKTGIQIRLISGVEEAKLIALGILSNESPSERQFALLDIGGGSTEISICRVKKVQRSFSFQLGTARLQQVFLKQTPPKKKNIEQLREFISNMISLKMQTEKWPKVKLILGSSGTVRALAKICKKVFSSEWIDRKELQDLIQAMAGMKTSQLLEIPSMESKRVDMILAGAILLDECMGALGAKIVVPTEYSLRDGILEEERELLEKGKKYHLFLHLEDLFRLGRLFGKEEKHLRSTVKIAEALFYGLKKVHRLDPEWGVYLSAATILRDVGEIISTSSHSEQSFYIIKNCDLPPMEDWEVDLIAHLCLYHEEVKYGLKSIKFSSRKVKLDTFVKLLAMLRVVNAVDTHPERVVRLKTVNVSKNGIHLIVPNNQITGLENQYLDIDKEFYEAVFGRGVKVVSV